MKKSPRFSKKWIHWLVIAVVALAAVALVYAARHRNSMKKMGQQVQQLVMGNDNHGFTPSRADSLEAKQRYEFGQPVDNLVKDTYFHEDDFTGDSSATARKGGKGGASQQSLKQKVRSVRAKYHQLQDVWARYQAHPTAQLAQQGNKLKSEVNAGLDELMPVAHEYDYQKGIDEGNDMRQNTARMNFDEHPKQ